ncbi:MAG: N-methyl-L-tryptophan oxidase [Gemmatimonadales bacterium]
MHPPPFDIAIAGLGAMGSAAAWQLASRGQRVIGFDRFRPPHSLGSSTGRSRIIREAYWESPAYVPIVRRAYELWSVLEQRSGSPLLQRTGGLVIGPEDGALVAGAIASARAHAVPYEVLTAADVRRRFPALQPDDALVGVLEPRAGVLAPEAAIAAMLAAASGEGAELHYDEPVLSWEPAGDGVLVQTARGEYSARRLVLATGAWMATELPGIRLPLLVQRQVMFWMRPSGDPAIFLPSTMPVWLWETREGPLWYGFPDLGDGPKVAQHQGGAVTTAEKLDRVVSESDSEPCLAFLESALPALSGGITDAQVCMYTNTPDEHFILDRHPDCPAVLLASPCSGHGFKFAPAIGEILADLAMDRPPAFDLAPFTLSRFARS